MNFVPKIAWKWFVVVYVLISTIVIGFSSLGGSWSMSIALIIMVAILIVFLSVSWNTIPQMHEWIVEFMGKYTGKPLKAGLHFIFPFFTTLRSDTLMSEQIMMLYLDESKDEAFGGGVVDFKNASAPVEAKAFIKITDAEKATYEISDVFKAIEERLDSALRSFLAGYTIDEAGSLKTYFKLGTILNGLTVEKKEGRPVIYKDEDNKIVTLLSDEKTIKYPDGTKIEPPVLEEIEKWGAEVRSIVITDIVLSPEIRKARLQKLEAEQQKEAAKDLKEATIIKSEGAMQAEINLGKGESKRFASRGTGMKTGVKKLAESGLSPKEASEHITRVKLYENIGDKTVVLESGNNSAVGQGAHIGAGAAAVTSAINSPKSTSPTPAP